MSTKRMRSLAVVGMKKKHQTPPPPLSPLPHPEAPHRQAGGQARCNPDRHPMLLVPCLISYAWCPIQASWHSLPRVDHENQLDDPDIVWVLEPGLDGPQNHPSEVNNMTSYPNTQELADWADAFPAIRPEYTFSQCNNSAISRGTIYSIIFLLFKVWSYLKYDQQARVVNYDAAPHAWQASLDRTNNDDHSESPYREQGKGRKPGREASHMG